MNVYEARHKGREFCNKTEGSDHYKEGGIEPLDLMIAKGLVEDFCIGNMSKYAFRFKKTRNLEDLKKVSDYAHILCGVELDKLEKAEQANVGKTYLAEGSELHTLLAAQEELKILEEIREAEHRDISVAALRAQNHCKKVNENMKRNTGFYDKE